MTGSISVLPPCIRVIKNAVWMSQRASARSQRSIHSTIAFQVILSASSSFFKEVLRQQAWLHSHPRPFIYLRGVSYNDLLSILDFVYNGEVNVAQNDLNSFLAVAAELQIKGLTDKDQLLSESTLDQTPSSKARSTPGRVKDSNGPPPKKRRRRARTAKTDLNSDNDVQAVSVEVDPNIDDDEHPDGDGFDKSFGNDESLEMEGDANEDEFASATPADGAKAVFPESSVLQYLEHVVLPGSQRKYHCTLCGMMSPFKWVAVNIVSRPTCVATFTS